MHRAIGSVALIGLFAWGVHALADDTVSRATPTNQQLMKECIEKQKETAVNMSKSELKRICKDQLKRQKQTGVPLDPPPTDTPKY
jgi:hypothetical protein